MQLVDFSDLMSIVNVDFDIFDHKEFDYIIE